jgi:formamidopyrimidine-DNA glycosylase
MPELPDITVYVEALERHVERQVLERIRVVSPFVVRSVDPPLSAAHGKTVTGVSRLGKRIVLGLDDEFFLIIHLMIAGRLRWKPVGVKVPKRNGLAAFDFPNGSVLFTEASRKQRASLHLVRGAAALREHDPGGIDVMAASAEQFRAALTRERHTLKRTLTDPHVFSGIGNAYSDEILHAARLSPLALTTALEPDEIGRLYRATQATLALWIDRLRVEIGAGFPDKVTAFRSEMAVHGRYRQACPACGAPVQRIRYAENEVNYCATCQTGGKVLADRGMSRLLKADWPRSLDEWEARFGRVS